MLIYLQSKYVDQFMSAISKAPKKRSKGERAIVKWVKEEIEREKQRCVYRMYLKDQENQL